MADAAITQTAPSVGSFVKGGLVTGVTILGGPVAGFVAGPLIDSAMKAKPVSGRFDPIQNFIDEIKEDFPHLTEEEVRTIVDEHIAAQNQRTGWTVANPEIGLPDVANGETNIYTELNSENNRAQIETTENNLAVRPGSFRGDPTVSHFPDRGPALPKPGFSEASTTPYAVRGVYDLDGPEAALANSLTSYEDALLGLTDIQLTSGTLAVSPMPVSYAPASSIRPEPRPWDGNTAAYAEKIHEINYANDPSYRASFDALSPSEKHYVETGRLFDKNLGSGPINLVAVILAA